MHNKYLTKQEIKLLLEFNNSSIGTLKFTDQNPEPGFIWKLEFKNLIRKHHLTGIPFTGNVRYYSLTPEGFSFIKDHLSQKL